MKRLIPTFLVFLLLSSIARAAVTFVALRGPVTGASPQSSSAFTTTAGDTIVAGGANRAATGQTATVSLSVDGSLTQTAGPTSYSTFWTVFDWAILSTSGNSQTLTITAGTAGQGIHLVGLEYSGVGSQTSVIAVVTGASAGTGTVSGTAETVPTGAALVAICINASGGSGINASPSGTSRGSGNFATGGNAYRVTEYTGSGGSITPTFSPTGSGDYVINEFVLFPPGTCTNSGYTNLGALVVPNGSSGTYALCTGAEGTPNCSGPPNYYQPIGGNCGVN